MEGLALSHNELIEGCIVLKNGTPQIINNDTIIDIIKGNCNNSEIIERIDNSSIDFQNFYSWGSLAFFI